MPLPLAGSKADAVPFFRVGDDDLGFSLVAVDDGFFLRLGQGIADLSHVVAVRDFCHIPAES